MLFSLDISNRRLPSLSDSSHGTMWHAGDDSSSSPPGLLQILHPGAVTACIPTMRPSSAPTVEPFLCIQTGCGGRPTWDRSIFSSNDHEQRGTTAATHISAATQSRTMVAQPATQSHRRHNQPWSRGVFDDSAAAWCPSLRERLLASKALLLLLLLFFLLAPILGFWWSLENAKRLSLSWLIFQFLHLELVWIKALL